MSKILTRVRKSAESSSFIYQILFIGYVDQIGRANQTVWLTN